MIDGLAKNAEVLTIILLKSWCQLWEIHKFEFAQFHQALLWT